jgi:uncharacterized protein YciI
MLWSVYCLDKPDSATLRQSTRPTHLAYLESYADRIVYGGALLAEDGQTVAGSLLVVNLPDRAAAQAFSDGDPYTKAGLFKSVAIHPTRKVFVNAAAAD